MHNKYAIYLCPNSKILTASFNVNNRYFIVKFLILFKFNNNILI